MRDFTYEDLLENVSSLGERPYRAAQLYRWIYGKSAPSIDAMTDISRALRERLRRDFYIGGITAAGALEAADGTVKMVFRLDGGLKIESVIIAEPDRTTLCVSSQAGCALGCAFCMTGRGGYKRDLKLSELTGQVFAARRFLKGGAPLTNIVLMGMGEPLINYDNVVRFVNILTDERGFGYSHNRVTVSTAGITPAIKRLGEDTSVNLAVSLNAPTDKLRSLLMPVNKKYPLKDLIKALKEYPLRGKRRITIEYVLLSGVNDSDAHARSLKKVLKGVRCKINIIPFNRFPGAAFTRPEEGRVRAFGDILMRGGYTVVTRKSRGADIGAACGQLKG